MLRSRPDLLSDTIRSSSPLREFKVPSQIPKQSIGPFLGQLKQFYLYQLQNSENSEN